MREAWGGTRGGKGGGGGVLTAIGRERGGKNYWEDGATEGQGGRDYRYS